MEVDKNIPVLFVDDAVGLRMVAQKMLKRLGFEDVTVADDGTTALEVLKSKRIDLVIADWQMPNMSGLELLKEMQQDDGLKHIPFLLATGDDDQSHIMEAIKAGINQYVNKPYDAEQMMAKIHRIFEFEEKKRQRSQNQDDI